MELKKYKLGEILDVTRGASLSGEFYATEGEYIRLTCGNFDYQNNCFKENKSKDNLYYTGDFRSEFLMEKGDIITPLTEQAIGLLGSTAIIPENGKYIQSQDVAKIICKEDLLDKDFAFYLISSTLVKQQLSATAQQTLYESKVVTFQLVGVVSQFIANVSNLNIVPVPPDAAPIFFNQSGPLVPILFNPFHSNMTDRSCSDGEVNFDNAGEVKKKG